MDSVKKLLSCSIFTYFVKNIDKNISLILVANPESTKTQLIKMIAQYNMCYYANDISFKLFIDDFLPLVERNEKHFLLIPDFINIVSHRRSFESFLPALNMFLEEGMKDIKYYGVEKQFSHSVKGSLITAVTKDIFERRIITFKNIGFLTRVIPITYKYSFETIKQIHKSIEREQYLDKYIEKLNSNFLRKNKYVVKIPDDVSDKISHLSEIINLKFQHYTLKYFNEEEKRMVEFKLEFNNYGFRLHKQLRTLAKGICLFNSKLKRFAVNENDFNDLEIFSKYMNFDFNEI